MFVKIFILGRPGTGKSTAARRMIEMAKDRKWSTEYIDDYQILHWMFENDSSNRFESVDFDGFNVLDFRVLEEALNKVRERVTHSFTRSLLSKRLVVIEFARGEYQTAIAQFGPPFLQDSYFLFLNANIDTCLKRIKWRVLHPQYKEDHYIGKETLENHYAQDDIAATIEMLKTRYHVDERHIELLKDIDVKQDFLNEVRKFIESIIEREMNVKDGDEGVPDGGD